MIVRAIKTFIKDPKPVQAADQVEPGLNVLDGTVRVNEPIRSPVRGVPCAAFFYRSFLFIPAKTPEAPPGMHKIKEAEAYASFTLEMDGGSIGVTPAKPGAFTQRDHQAFQARYGNTFQGIEETILPGARVRVRGKVKIQNGEKILILKEITVLNPPVPAGKGTGARKKRKKSGK